MKNIQIALFIFSLIILQGCKNGAETIPELGGEIFHAFQQNNAKKLLTNAPTLSGYEKAYSYFYTEKYNDKTELQKQATNEAATMRLNLNIAFKHILAQAKDKKIDWKQTKIHDLKYIVKDRKEGYKEAKVRMILESGIDKNVVLFDAINYEKRWYLLENLRWEE